MVAKNPSSKIEKETEKVAKELLDLLGFNLKTKVEVDDSIKVNIEGEDLGLLIGSYGEHLESLQIILGILVNKRLDGEWQSLVLDVGGWRKSREEDLKDLVDREVAKLGESSKEIQLPPMPPSQRRAVHIYASEHKGVESSSEGEEPNRRIVLRRVEDGKN